MNNKIKKNIGYWHAKSIVEFVSKVVAIIMTHYSSTHDHAF